MSVLEADKAILVVIIVTLNRSTALQFLLRLALQQFPLHFAFLANLFLLSSLFLAVFLFLPLLLVSELLGGFPVP